MAQNFISLFSTIFHLHSACAQFPSIVDVCRSIERFVAKLACNRKLMNGIPQNKQRSLVCFKATTGYTVQVDSFRSFHLILSTQHFKHAWKVNLCSMRTERAFEIVFCISDFVEKKIRNEFKRHQNSKESYQVSMNKKFSKSSKTLGLSFVSRLVQAVHSLSSL